jgi:hypothetical protein
VGSVHRERARALRGPLSTTAITGVLRGVGRASAAPAPDAPATPADIVEDLRRRIDADPDLKKDVAIRILSVPSAPASTP